jgi:hypothetical protein
MDWSQDADISSDIESALPVQAHRLIRCAAGGNLQLGGITTSPPTPTPARVVLFCLTRAWSPTLGRRIEQVPENPITHDRKGSRSFEVNLASSVTPATTWNNLAVQTVQKDLAHVRCPRRPGQPYKGFTQGPGQQCRGWATARWRARCHRLLKCCRYVSRGPQPSCKPLMYIW